MKLFVLLGCSLLCGFSHAAENQTELKNESEVGFVLTKGNTDTQTLSAKHMTSTKFDENVFTFKGSYLNSKTNSVNSADNWSLSLRAERILSDRFSLFLGETVVGDQFQLLRQRYNSDLGVKYYTFKEETFYWFAEAGYRFSHENFSSGISKNNHIARTYTEAEKKWNEGVSTKYWLEYLPNFSAGKDWMINSEFSVSAILTSLFSIKSAYLVRFDHQPVTGLKKTDSTVTTSLVAKF